MQEQSGSRFTDEQHRWLGRIKDHIASATAIDTNAFNLPPFAERGGIGKAYEVFGQRLEGLLNELSEVLVA